MFVIWDLGGIGQVKNVATGSTNISSYRQSHPEIFFDFFLTFFYASKKQKTNVGGGELFVSRGWDAGKQEQEEEM